MAFEVHGFFSLGQQEGFGIHTFQGQFAAEHDSYKSFAPPVGVGGIQPLGGWVPAAWVGGFGAQ